MRNGLRRVRGALGIGFIWGAVWSVVGGVPRGVFGFIAGVTFSGLLVLTERRRIFDEMSIRRFAVWGIVGGLLLSAVFARAASLGWGDVLALAPTLAIASALCATGSLAVARRAAGERQTLPESGE